MTLRNGKKLKELRKTIEVESEIKVKEPGADQNKETT